MDTSMWSALTDEKLGVMAFSDDEKRAPKIKTTIDKLPDKILMHIFSYLSHREICRKARVCKKWRVIAYDHRLWKTVSLRPEYSGLHVSSLESLLSLINVRFGPSLRYIELPIELITHTVLHELAAKCPNLTFMLLDFSTAMQLHDFNEMQAFPTKLRTMCICLSEVIFMEGFMRKIYNFINGLEVLHLIGTYDKVEEEEEEIYEVINIHKLKAATPNLKVVNLYGITFLDDNHVEGLSSSCMQLECLSVSFCARFTGSSLKTLVSRCRKLSCLLLQQTNLKSENVLAVEWDKASLLELDISGSSLSTDCLIDLLTRLQGLRYLACGSQDGFTDKVLRSFMEKGDPSNLVALDLDRCDSLSEDAIYKFVSKYGSNLKGLVLSGIPHIGDGLWTSVLRKLSSARILVMGSAESWKIHQKILVDQLLDCISINCPLLERLELSWDPETLRFSDKSQKAIDALRVRCLKIKSLALTDGKYYETVKANFERADRGNVVRTTVNCKVSNCYLLNFYNDLLFN